MPSTKFHTVSQSDDYKLDNLPEEPLRYSHNIEDPVHSSQTPGRWKPSKSGYAPKVTYVSAPDGTFNNDATGRPEARNRRKSSRLSFRQLVNPVSDFRIPTFAAPWQHEIPESSQSLRADTVRKFDRRKQWQRLFVNSILQWFVTVGIVLCQFGTLYGFSQPLTLSRAEKYTFNALTILLSLCLGLAITTALRAYAKILSWRFLASGYRNLQDFELVMNCDSQSKVLKLFFAGRTPGRFGINKTQLLCVVSIALVVGLQITIGLLGLCYSIETSEYLRFAPGKVSLVDLSNVYQDSTYNETGISDQTGSSHYYGLVGQNYEIYDAPLGQGSNGPESIYTADNITFFYQYVEWSEDSKSVTPSYSISDRYVTADANCVTLEIISGGYVVPSDSESTLYYKDEHGVERHIYVEGNTVTTSTYMSNSSSDCGARCTSILILDTGYMPANDTTDPDDVEIKPHLFACNSTVSEVYKSGSCSYAPNCTLSDENAKYLAGSIGWTGTWFLNGNPLQYQTFPSGSPYSWDGFEDSDYQDPAYRAQDIAIFTADALAAMDDAGPRIVMDGRAPKPAVALEVKWQYAIPVLCVVPAVQFLVLFLVCIFANGALIQDGGYLSTARLLKPVVEKLEEHGCALTSDEIARALGNFKIVYGVRAPPGTRSTTAYTSISGSDVDWHVGVIAESEGYGDSAEEGWKPTATFSQGRYDGTGYPTIIESSGKRRKVRIIVEEGSDDDLDEQMDEKAYLLQADCV
ncbi:hypothetical protein PMZ80_009855 [Knufia obscura]|nr:hypothetical protein PMZ80_009855 [Knufia obscura]